MQETTTSEGTPVAADKNQDQVKLHPVATIASARKLTLIALIFTTVYAADQATKYIVETTMTLGQAIPVIDGLLWWRYYLNPGAAFSMGENHTWIFTLIMVAATGVTLYTLYRARTLYWVIALAGLLGGILGNLTDRLFRSPGFGVGHVVDFISLPNFAIFNIADSAICLSMAAIVLLTFLGIRTDGQREITPKN